MKQFLGLLLLLCSKPVLAQHHTTLHFINDDTHQSIPGVTVQVRPTGTSAAADSNGVAVLPGLKPGKYAFQCTSEGFREKEFSLSVGERDTTLTVILDPMVETMQDVVIASTRTNRLLKNTPTTIQVVDREDIEEGTAQSPANIRELLTELSGTQVQQTSPVSGNVSIRLQGLDGRYTQLLKDGFPLYGGLSGSLSILQVPPLDLRQVEVIKGAGSALYGGDAIAGIINLISRTPDTTLHLDAVLNQTDKGGTDLGGFFSHRGKHTGLTVMGSASRQNPVDVNNDGFTDLPRVRQGTVAPTFFWYPDDSTTLRLGVNISTEDRNGGDLQAVEHGADSLHPFLQRNHSDRDYYQLSMTRKLRGQQSFTLKNTVGYFYRSIEQTTGGAGGLATTGFSGAEVSSFTEASYNLTAGAHDVVTGIGLTTDQFKPGGSQGNLGYTHNTAGLFAQDDWTLDKKTVLEAGARADVEHTLYFLPRLALLYRPVRPLSIRLGGGLAYKLPTIFNATDEEEGYQQVYPIASSVQAERSESANLSVNYQGHIGDDIGFTIDQNLYYTRLMHALIPQEDSLQRGWLYYLNAPGPVLSRGSETDARFTLERFSLYIGYTYTDARRVYLSGDPQLPLTPHHRFVSTLTYEAEPHWKAGIEGFYTGTQVLDDGQTVRDFWTNDLMVQHTWGHCSLMLNVENFLDTRQSKFGPLFTGTMQNPVFQEVYAPIDGRVISVAFRYTR
ncbi:TonB-dependent receptor [Dinghuibacter silviterrae]|uniref:Iron complex outermembrane receptor protein n=1 Tax=Dinghuibacter silviterrae TaxID=1539049 RepID=A0A4R8DGW6_9BACT|nr:TonB-dependent receptor [Dinghuibacter silviterrae]TDW96717.1 iron complex outermembrane receptor protein [Dinghuibacter silviterrae]